MEDYTTKAPSIQRLAYKAKPEQFVRFMATLAFLFRPLVAVFEMGGCNNQSVLPEEDPMNFALA